MRRAKIIATIGPASESEDTLRRLILAGIDIARINMSHGERERHGETIARIRRVEHDLQRPTGILLDLAGPKIRTGKLRGGTASLIDGTEVKIIAEQIEGDARCFSANYPLLPREVHRGDRILIDDGQIVLEVLEGGDSYVMASVVHGGMLGEHKGINLPGARISIPSVTDKDVADLRFGIERGVDLVALSFVRSHEDCRRAQDLIRKFGGNVPLIAKIEKPEAIDDLTNILDTADGVMVARGDLAVETSPEIVPVLQKRIIYEALIAEKSVITATQMLQSMIENPQPTRAEASDVANAVLDGSDAVMLSGETAIGSYPIETVTMMDKIIRSAEEIRAPAPADSPARENRPVRISDTPAYLFRRLRGRQSGSYGRAIAEAATFAAAEVNCRLIVVFTKSGIMARHISALRPSQRIIALTPSDQTRHQLALSWGVESYLLEEFAPFSDEILASGDRALVKHRLAEPGEMVVVMAGQFGNAAITSSMKLHRVGQPSEK
jgi:pyruvate kinase